MIKDERALRQAIEHSLKQEQHNYTQPVSLDPARIRVITNAILIAIKEYDRQNGC